MNTKPYAVPDKSSRSLDALFTPVKIMALAFVHACRMEGIDILVTCTYRSGADQDGLFAKGRTAPGGIVTNARAGESLHQYGVAFDVVPMRNGKAVWGTAGEDGKLWARVGELGEAAGLEWAGRWKRFREFPHFQFTDGLTLADFKAGKLPPQA